MRSPKRGHIGSQSGEDRDDTPADQAPRDDFRPGKSVGNITDEGGRDRVCPEEERSYEADLKVGDSQGPPATEDDRRQGGPIRVVQSRAKNRNHARRQGLEIMRTETYR